MKYAKYFIIAGLILFTLGTFSPPITRAAEVPTLIISDSLRSSLLQLITLLQRLQTLKIPSVVTPLPVVIPPATTSISSQLKINGGQCSPPDENTKPLGGYSSGAIFSCNCSDGYLINVGSPRGGTFHIKSSTRICEYGNARSPGWVLGNYYPNRTSECLFITGDNCSVRRNNGVVQMIGTSR